MTHANGPVRFCASNLEPLEKRVLLSMGPTTGHDYGEVLRPEALPLQLAPRARGDVSIAGAAGFQLEVRFPDLSLSPTQRAAFTAAADRWELILTGDLPDVNSDIGLVDDLVIDATGPEIDGPLGVLGQAGPTGYRPGTFLPARGMMEFDQADLLQMETGGQLVGVIVHEMGHVLGLGTFWGAKGLLSGEGGTNPRYTGANATAEYNRIFGAEGVSVPVENGGGAGTRDSHWREATFDNELMTGYLNGGRANPLSRVTAAQFVDMGYPGVVVSAADAYTPPNPPPVAGALSASPPVVTVGGSVSLTATGFSDPGGSVASVSFYREANGLPGLQGAAAVPTGTPDVLLGTDASSANGFTLAVSTAGLAAGTYNYYARATDGGGALSTAASATLTVQEPQASQAPGAPDLVEASDTGVSSADNVTRLDNATAAGALQFSVPATVPGATVTLLIDGVAAGTAVATGTTTVVGTNGATDLADGTHQVTAAQAEPRKSQSAQSAATLLTVDTTAPRLLASAFLYQSTSPGVSFTFGENVRESLSQADVAVAPAAGAANFTAAPPGYDAAANTATLQFSAIPVDGNYRATLSAAGVTDAAGNTLSGGDAVLDFFFLQGDYNRDRRVDSSDFTTLASNFARPSRGFTDGDGNYDGAVNSADFTLLAANFGKTLATPATVTSQSSPVATAAAVAEAPAPAASTARRRAISHRRSAHRGEPARTVLA